MEEGKVSNKGTMTAGQFVESQGSMIRIRTLGDALTLVIRESGISYHDLGNRVGASKSDIQSWEKGEDKPTNQQMQKLFTTFPRLRQLAQTLPQPEPEVDPADADAILDAATRPAPTRAGMAAPAKVALPDLGEIGDLERAGIEYARAIRDHQRAVAQTAEYRKKASEAEAEATRLDALVTDLFGKIQGKAGFGR